MVIVQKRSENVSPCFKKLFRTFTIREILPAKPLVFGYTRGNVNRIFCPFHFADDIFRAVTMNCELCILRADRLIPHFQRCIRSAYGACLTSRRVRCSDGPAVCAPSCPRPVPLAGVARSDTSTFSVPRPLTLNLTLFDLD